MKRLMIALSAAAMAFGLYAGEEIKSETFNDSTDVPESITAPGDSKISETSYKFTASETVGIPLDAVPGYNLSVKTAFNSPASFAMDSAKTMAGLYFDSLVKFTACDEEPAAAEFAQKGAYEGAKLVVWVKEIEGEAGAITKELFVTAGYLNDTDNNPVLKHYDCGDFAKYAGEDETEWCRLTIKAKADITDGDGVPGFVVFLNAQPVTIATDKAIGVDGSAKDKLTKVNKIWADQDRLFPSLVAQESTLTSVGFAGQGGLDDLLFTTVEPIDAGSNEFALDPVPSVAQVVVGNVTNECKTVAEINAAIALADGSASVKVVLADSLEKGLNFTVAELGESVEVAEFVLDLAGNTITAAAEPDEGETKYAINVAFDPLCALTIIDSVGGGVVDGEVNADGILIVEAGTFEDQVGFWYSDEAINAINGGRFEAEANEDLLTNEYITFPAKKMLAEGEGEDEGYLVLVDRPKEKFDVTFLDAEGEEFAVVSVEDGSTVTPPPTTPAALKAWESFDKWDFDFATPITEATEINPTFKFLDKDANNNYLIATKEDLNKFKLAVEGDATLKAASYKLTDNIALTETWAPIAEFKGTFDGGDNTISNLKFDRAAGNYQGLFGNVTGGTISNLKLVLADWTGTSSGEYGGAALAGKATTSATFNNITVSGSLIGATHNVAGIVCRTYGGTFTFNACTNKAEIGGGYSKVGGLVNMVGVSGTTTFNDCSNEGHIYVTNASKGENGGVGAFVAYYESTASVVLSGCSSTGLLENQNAASGQGVGAFVNAPNGTGTVSAGAKPNVANVAYWPGNVRVSGHYVGFGAAVVKNGLATWYADYASAMAALDDATAVKVFVTDNVITPPFNSKSFNLTEIANVANGKVGIGTKVDKDITDSLSTYAVAGTKLEAGEGFWTVVADTPADPWPAPTTDDKVADAIKDAGFSDTAKSAITTVEGFNAFKAYCKDTLELSDPAIPGSNIKANALISYALDCGKLTEALTSDDVKIASYDAASGEVVVTIEGVTPGENVKPEILAKVLTAKGGDDLKALAADKVNVSGQGVAEGVIKVTVTPKVAVGADAPTTFFTQIELNK